MWSKCVGGIKELVVLGVTLIARLTIEDARLSEISRVGVTIVAFTKRARLR